MRKLLLVDGHNLLFQMFYGMPSRIIGKNGQSIQAVVGFIGALLKVIKNIQASHVVVLFDGENGSHRVDENLEYKGNRKDYTDAADEDNPFLQLNEIIRALDFAKIKHFEIIERMETDDIIASYALKYKNDFDVYILSNDTDFMQLVEKNVRVYVYRGKKSTIYDDVTVFNKYGVRPQYFADYKSLVGDSSDNIRGIRGIGPKTAKKLIDKFGHVEDIVSNMDSMESGFIKSQIAENTDILFANMKLIRLSKITATPYEIDALCFNDYENYRTVGILKEINLM